MVDDFEPFRRLICSTLAKRPELQVIGEASDGLEAVQKAGEQHPDFIMLDIGLPGLSGIEAARRIRKLSPSSKIVFVSQESSAEVVEEALSLGALGYVVKTQAGSSLLAAVDAVLLGGRFVSQGISGHKYSDATAMQRRDIGYREVLRSPGSKTSVRPRSHEVEFYSDDAALVEGFGQFIEAALNAGKSIILVSSDSHQKSLRARFQERGINTHAAVEQGRYFPFEVEDILPTFVTNDELDPVRFLRVVGNLIAAASRSTGEPSRVAICGETASILWAQGNADAAIQVEQLCNRLAKQHGIDILCGFTADSMNREEDQQIFQRIAANAEPASAR